MTELIPLDVLFGNPERDAAEISPDGTRLAYLAPDAGVLNVWVGTLGADDARPVTNDRGRGVRFYTWAHDGRHVLYIQDRDGDENWHLYTVDLQTGEVHDRTPFDGAQARVLALSKQVPERVIVGINADDPRYHDAYDLDLRSGKLEKLFANPGFDDWLVDRQLRVRGGERVREDASVEYVIGEGDPSGWPVVLTVAAEDASIGSSWCLGFDAAGEQLYFITPMGANTSRLVRFDPRTKRFTVLAEDPEYDVAGATLHPDTREPQLAFVDRGRRACLVLDDALTEELQILAAPEQGEFHPIARDHDDATWVIAYTRDNACTRYCAWHRADRRESFLFDTHPALAQYELAEREPFAFTARDGLTIHGYATFPPGAGRRNLPTIVHVHGGPWGARHSWSYDATAQWLANRGYLVLEVNYRGSGGYGKAFVNASAQEWAGRMHDDLLDGVQWATDHGHADQGRVGIFGGSYGGYAALVGATFTPDAFRCAVSIVGPSNLITLLETIPPYWVGLAKMFDRLLGNPERDREFLWSRSPLSRVDAIRIPMLIAQGANDPRVKQAESEQIVAAMRERGIDHEYLLYPDEGHGFARPENRLHFSGAAERFLAKHLGGRCA